MTAPRASRVVGSIASIADDGPGQARRATRMSPAARINPGTKAIIVSAAVSTPRERKVCRSEAPTARCTPASRARSRAEAANEEKIDTAATPNPIQASPESSESSPPRDRRWVSAGGLAAPVHINAGPGEGISGRERAAPRRASVRARDRLGASSAMARTPSRMTASAPRQYIRSRNPADPSTARSGRRLIARSSQAVHLTGPPLGVEGPAERAGSRQLQLRAALEPAVGAHLVEGDLSGGRGGTAPALAKRPDGHFGRAGPAVGAGVEP